MPHYRIFSVDRQPVQIGEVEADDDKEAIRILAINGANACELWCGGRFVTEYPPYTMKLRTVI